MTSLWCNPQQYIIRLVAQISPHWSQYNYEFKMHGCIIGMHVYVHVWESEEKIKNNFQDVDNNVQAMLYSQGKITHLGVRC